MAIKNKNRERDRFTVVLEAIQSDFHVFGEKLEFIDARLGRMESRLDGIELRLDNVESELISIKLELSELKTKLDKKAYIERVEKLEGRIKRIEIVLAKEKRG
jgi:chromosome segregation ATPase